MTRKGKIPTKVAKKEVSKIRVLLPPSPPGGEAKEELSFRDLVYKLCKTIPKGTVTTYGEIAKALLKPNASRAVGNALRNNPYAPIVPCHRVVSSTRAIGGFYGHKSGPEIQRKIQMLKEESVSFDDDGKVSQSCIYKFA
jgi:methylated-DNA-[protein]-cysteine S-methyltransferase